MELFPNGGAVNMLIWLINIGVKYAGISGALPETLEAGAVGRENEFRDPGRLTQTTQI